MIKKIVFITGLGGSGTRVYANILDILNINLGTNINNSKDNLSFETKTPQALQRYADERRLLFVELRSILFWPSCTQFSENRMGFQSL